LKWIKKGLIYKPNPELWWSKKYGILPTPEYLETENKIRIYFASTDENIYGRVSYIDVNAENPSEVLFQHNRPVLDIGRLGTFDDCGVNVSSVVNVNGKKFLYYVGYQRCERVPYMLFPGLAKSTGENSFIRQKATPIIDRTDKYPYSMAAPFVMNDDGKFKMWLWIARDWTKVNDKDYLAAQIGYAESQDGIDWKIVKDDCIVPVDGVEFSVGRPWVIKENSLYKMFYSVRHIGKMYRMGYAESANGLAWNRKDNEVGIDTSPSGWDSEMICYPAVLKTKEKTYLFYNGNKNGIEGFGYAELEPAS
jgi:predicted GH43/DUF377 family glycosyl hydrolase